MSGPGPGGGRGPGWSPLHFRPPSPYAQSPPPRLGSPNMNMFGARLPHMPCPRPRWPSPGPIGSPLPRGMSPPPIPPYGPRPFRMPMHPPSPAPMRCSSPVPDFFRGVSPYSMHDPHRGSPYMSDGSHRGSPYMQEYGPPSREYEYIGVPMEPPPLPQNYEPDDDEHGPSTAEIIANQSQDYIDEKLAEYQMTIYQLQGKHLSR